MRQQALLIVCTFAVLLASCKTYQDVSPQLESAIQSYESAKQLESQLVEVETGVQLRIVEDAFRGLEDAALTSLRSVLRSGWDAVAGDFQPNRRDIGWEAWFGAAGPFDPDRLAEERSRIRSALNDSFDWPSGTGGPTPVWTLFSRGIGPAQLGTPPTESDLAQLESEYEAWMKHFEQDVLRRAPVYLKVVRGHERAVSSIGTQRLQRTQRMDLVYNDLITLAKMARDQAKSLTDNAGFISMANNVARMANRFLADATNEAVENGAASGSGAR